MTHQRITYQDLDIEIGPGEGRDYPTKIRSPGGEAAGVFRLPYGPAELESRLKDVQIALLRATGRRRTALTPQEQAVRDFGRALFDALFAGELRGCYDRSLLVAGQKGDGLRIRLRIQPPELLALPWEFLYDPRAGEYLCLSRHTPLVRYVELPQPTQPLAVTLPLRILALAAGPEDLPPLDLEQERKRLERAVEPLRQRGLVKLCWLEGGTWRDLRRTMVQQSWHVFHFIGHGGFSPARDEGFLALCDEHGEMHRLFASGLARVIGDQRSLRLVILNSCDGARSGGRDEFSSTASILVRRGIPAVIGMQDAITDIAGIEFTHHFYEALAEGLSVDTAVTDARIAIGLALGETLEWGVPVLFLRSEDSLLFEVSQVAQSVEKTDNELEQAHTRLVEMGSRYVAKNDDLLSSGVENNILTQDQAEKYYRNAVASNSKGEYDQAILDLNRAIILCSDDARYYRERALSYMRKEVYTRAIDDYNRAVDLNPFEHKYYWERGLYYIREKSFGLAIDDIKFAIELESKRPRYYRAVGVCYNQKGDDKEAIPYFDAAIRLDPNNSRYYRDRGVSYCNIGENDQAIADFDLAIHLDPSKSDYYFQRGVSYNCKRDYERAISDINRAIQLDEYVADYYYELGIIYENANKIDDAKNSFRKAVNLGSSSAKIRLSFIRPSTRLTPPEPDYISDIFEE